MMETDRGLDLANLGATTDKEKADFQTFYTAALGRTHPGLDFWLDNGPDVLKRYRAFATAEVPGDIQGAFTGFGFLQHYALLGYTEGVRYLVRLWQEQRLSKEQVLEGLSIGFLHMGPRGMETVAEALDGYAWLTPDTPARFPDGWSPDSDAFRSGMDFSRREVTEMELEALRSWYERTIGEVPRSVTYLVQYRPEALNAFRSRYENCLQLLPKQVMPYTLLHYNTIRGFGDGIRENVRLARAFGMTRQQALRPIYSALLNAGIETVSLVDRVTRPLFAEWDR
jgi:hypothetical protein